MKGCAEFFVQWIVVIVAIIILLVLLGGCYAATVYVVAPVGVGLSEFLRLISGGK